MNEIIKLDEILKNKCLVNTKEIKLYTKKKGIYFLIERDEIAYIGKSKNFAVRLRDHIYAGKMFNFFSFFETDKRLDTLEALHILYYMPKLNKRIDRIFL